MLQTIVYFDAEFETPLHLQSCWPHAFERILHLHSWQPLVICHVASGLELSHGLRAIPSSDTDLAWRNLSSLTLWDPLTDCLRKY